MRIPRLFGRASRPSVLVAAVAVMFATAGLVVGANLQPPKVFTPNSEDQITNIDILRSDIKNYYGTPGASTGPSAGAGWTLALEQDSFYAQEARSVAEAGTSYLMSKAGKAENQAVVFDVDDTTLTTYDYELYSNWDYNPTTNSYFVGLTGTTWSGNVFPAAPGMYDLLWNASNAGYAIFFITGRPDSQHQVTIANLLDDAAAGLTPLTTTTSAGLSQQVDEVDANYPAPTGVDTGHGLGGVNFTDGLFTKPPRPSTDALDLYPAYLDTAEFCASFIASNTSCPTIQYKSGTRAYIESLGYDIVANFGDQFSDLLGGYADKTFKMPNPNYYLP